VNMGMALKLVARVTHNISDGRKSNSGPRTRTWQFVIPGNFLVVRLPTGTGAAFRLTGAYEMTFVICLDADTVK
jgi:hypothetical protein